MSPYIPRDEWAEYGIGTVIAVCAVCRQDRWRMYCRQCDEFFARCPCPDAHQGHRLYPDGAPDPFLRLATEDEQRAALVALCRARVQAGEATHDCGEWFRDGACELCDRPDDRDPPPPPHPRVALVPPTTHGVTRGPARPGE